MKSSRGEIPATHRSPYRPVEFSVRTKPANHRYRQGVQGSVGVITPLSPLRRPTTRKQVSAHLDCPLNANRQRQATVAGLQAGQELLSATLFPVDQQNSDQVLFEELKNGNPLCLCAWPERARSSDEYPCGPCVRPEWSLHTSRRSPQDRRGLIERWPRPLGSTLAPVPAPPQSRRSSLDCTDQ
jgi:hypothetical protein